MATRLSFLRYRFRSLKQLNPCWPKPVSHTFSTNSVLQRAVKAVKNDPFVKISLSLCLLIGGGTLIMEVNKKWKRSATHGLLILPSGFAHYSIKRQSLLCYLHNEFQKLGAMGSPPLLYITGPPGSGKTELARQFCNYYATISKKWLGLKSVPPIVLSMNAASPQLLQYSLAEAASTLGLHQSSNLDDLFSAIVTKLTSDRLPWLLVVDNLTKDSSPCFQQLIHKYMPKTADCQQGAILVTTQFPPVEKVPHSVCNISRLSVEQSVELFEHISGLQSSQSMYGLLDTLGYNPMAIALAASTIKIYCAHLPASECTTVLGSYQDLLAQNSKGSLDSQQAAVNLYCEVATSESCIQHMFDFFGSCDLNYPIPVSVLPIHLGLDFYGIPDEALAPPPLDPILANLRSSIDHDSYWSRIKSMVPFVQPSSPSDEDIAKALIASQDEIAFIRQSPILSFKRSWHGDFEFVTVHSAAHQKISELFTDVTVSKLDKDFLSRELKEFKQNSWFQNYRKFDTEKSLSKFHRMLPGLSSLGVFTEAQFYNVSVVSESRVVLGTKTPDNMDYSQYVHVVSHYHRVVSSLVSTLRSVRGEVQDVLVKKCLLPHFQAIKNFPYISQTDKLNVDISLLVIDAADWSSEDEGCIAQYENLITEQKALLGTRSVDVACSLVDFADLQLSWNKAYLAKELLQSALDIYNQVPAHLRHGALALDMSHTLSSLGLACDELGEKEESKNFYDQALATSQSVPPSGRVGTQQRKLVASLLVSMVHAYLSVGDLLVAKKYSELAAMMLQSVYPQGHKEMVRLLNIRSIVSALLGDKEGSSKFRVEASKLIAKLG